MRRPKLARVLLIAGALACIPGAAAVLFFANGVAAVNALRDGPTCKSPTRDAGSDCLSLFNGTVTQRIPGSTKFLPKVVIDMGGSTATVAFDCLASPYGACFGTNFDAGTEVVTGWWKGQLVAIGLPGSRPAVVTDQSPQEHLGWQALALVLVIPGVSLVLAGLFVLRAPMNDKQLITWALKQWPDPPRPVDKALVQRVAWGYLGLPGYALWAILYFVPLALFIGLLDDFRVIPPMLLVATFVVGVGLNLLAAPAYLDNLVQSSFHRTVVVERVEPPTPTGHRDTRFWYQRVDGKMAKMSLAAAWNGHITAGDRLDALTDKSGSIVRLLSIPPANA